MCGRVGQRADSVPDVTEDEAREMAETADIREMFAQIMEPLNFERKGSNWFDRNDDRVLVVNLQRSLYGPMFFVNCGIWLNAVEQVRFPKDNHCHLRTRIEYVEDACSEDADTEARAELVALLLDAEASMPDTARKADLEPIVQSAVTRLRSWTRTLDSIREAWDRGDFDAYSTDVSAYAVLDRA